jgi:hypothetical protein
MIMSHYLKSGQNQNIRIANESFENVSKFRYLGMMLENQNDIHDEIKSRLNSGNACYYSVQNLLSSHLILKNLKFKIYKTVILPFVLYGCKTCCLTLREEYRLRVLRRGCWEHLDLKGRKMDHGENCIMMNFTAILYRILLRWLNQGRWGGQDMCHVWERHLQGFGSEAWG